MAEIRPRCLCHHLRQLWHEVGFVDIKIAMLVRDDRAEHSGGVYNESTLVLVGGVVVDCLVNGLEAGGEDGSSSVPHVLGSVSGLFAILSAAAPAVGCNVTFLASLVAFDAGLNLLRALPGRLFLPSYIRLDCRVRIR
jgi:hypothetical protein